MLVLLCLFQLTQVVAAAGGGGDGTDNEDEVDAVVDAVVADLFTLNIGMIDDDSVVLDQPKSAATCVKEAHELLLIESATHICMAKAQRALYQAHVVKSAVCDASKNKEYSARTYLFVVNYSQNMVLPVYNDEQPGCMYYYSPLSVYNLGVVNHVHDYGNGMIAAHMHCHVYHECIVNCENIAVVESFACQFDGQRDEYYF